MSGYQEDLELVLRLVRGESLDAVSRESQVPALELERGQRIFVEQGKRGLRTLYRASWVVLVLRGDRSPPR